MEIIENPCPYACRCKYILMLFQLFPIYKYNGMDHSLGNEEFLVQVCATEHEVGNFTSCFPNSARIDSTSTFTTAACAAKR